MSIQDNDGEDGLINALITAFRNPENMPSRTEIETRAQLLAPILEYEGDVRAAVEYAETCINMRMGMGVSLTDPAAEHDEDWINKRDIDWVHANAHEKYLLKDEQWSPSLVQSLSDVTSRLLGLLQDPISEGAWDRRGLVIGHVQSGKTANYLGLVAKAADAGYKFIVIIAGIHNNLRKQTQMRVDAGFIGRSSDPENRVSIGVGLTPDYPHPVTLTNVHDDFNKNTAAKSGWKINDFSKPIILVIKKNVRTLEALHGWLKDLNAQGDGRIRDVPMLMIDDEADNASINTNREELDPTRTNACIRKILALFTKTCYVGYTATPFANIFINPKSYDDAVRDDLFPRDFIYTLDAPTAYFGPDRVFEETEDGHEPYVRSISDCEAWLPLRHKRGDALPDHLPPSLCGALDRFIVARAVRNLRGQARKHSSMLINMSRFVSKQREIRSLVSLRMKHIREAVKANYRMPEASSAKNPYMADLRQAFDEEYVHCGQSWEAVRDALWGVVDTLRIFVINSSSAEALDYERYGSDGDGLTAIAIGGLSLSRGLTIEGLTVSYMYRNTRMYDTLMQMGRWFGYRFGYEDLCRVHLPQDSINWYAHIADASEELRQQIRQMRRNGQSPKDFGLYVKDHPDSLLITAANKMRTGKTITVEQSWSGKLLESHLVSTDAALNIRNFALIAECWQKGFGGVTPEDTGKGWIFRGVPTESVEDFLRCFECPDSFSVQREGATDYLHKIAAQFPQADVLLISPREGAGGDQPFMLRHQERTLGQEQLQNNVWHLTKDRVASRGDEKLGLDDVARKAAQQDANEDGKGVSDRHYRKVRNKPLLMLHSLQPKGSLVAGPIAAFGISFPYIDCSITVQVVANRVWIQQNLGPDDKPDEEDDFDAC
jgi:hypothetical protein